MRVRRAVVRISASSMFTSGQELALSHAIASQLVGHDHAWVILTGFQQTSEETLCSFGIAPRLNEDVENGAVLIHDAPQIMLHTRVRMNISSRYRSRLAGGGAAV